MKQYSYNDELDVTRRDLLTTKQRPDETLAAFIVRWRGKVSQMRNRPADDEQIDMVLKAMLPQYYERLYATDIQDFSALMRVASRVEEKLAEATRVEQSLDDPKANETFCTHGGSQLVSAIADQLHGHPHSAPGRSLSRHVPRCKASGGQYSSRGPQRVFSDLGMTPSRAFEKLGAANRIAPLEPRAVPNPPPPGFMPHEFCKFHQGPGHDTDRCLALKHTLQNMVDEGKLVLPEDRARMKL
jgi:hypothetical protein